jgi:serine/threonine protein kinase
VPTLAGYELDVKLGEGTCGEVWKARHAPTGVQVAVKFLRPPNAERRQFREVEVQVALSLGLDRRIVHVIDVEEHASPPYIIMDYAEHGSLATRLERGPLPLNEALAIFRDVVEAMAHANAKGICHGNLKPRNILFDAADRPRIADFSASHLSVGTFFYMAPEQAALEQRVADARWDVYALGAVLYTMLTGSPPRADRELVASLAEAADLSQRLKRYREWVEHGPVPSGHRAVPGVDRALAAIIDRCLSADPAARYRDTGALLAALQDRDRRSVRPRVWQFLTSIGLWPVVRRWRDHRKDCPEHPFAPEVAPGEPARAFDTTTAELDDTCLIARISREAQEAQWLNPPPASSVLASLVTGLGSALDVFSPPAFSAAESTEGELLQTDWDRIACDLWQAPAARWAVTHGVPEIPQNSASADVEPPG